MSAGGIEGSPVVYRRRWYILMIFSFHAMFQCTVWNTWVGRIILNMDQYWDNIPNWNCIQYYGNILTFRARWNLWL